jgi:S1-C subfamily serine protease
MRSLICTVSATTALVLLAGCGESNSGSSNTRAATDPARSVIYVEAIYGEKRARATGVIYDQKRGLALTANHAVEAAPAIEVTLNDGTLLHGRPVARAQCHDLAVLQLSPRPISAPAIRFGNSAAVGLGDVVRTLFYALGGPTGEGAAHLTNVRGNVSSLNVRQAFPPLPTFGPFVAHQTPLTASASGSPLLNLRGQMVGINTLVAHPRGEDALPGIEYALTSNYERRRLGELRPGRGGAFGGWQAEHDACHSALNRLIAKGHTDTHK